MDDNIEERLRTGLRSSAETVSVPDDLPARIERRITLRRRQALTARVAATIMVLSLAGGALWLNANDTTDVFTGSPPADPARWADWQPPPAGETLPALTVEADGIELARASEDSGPIEPAPEGVILGPPRRSFQVFRQPGAYAGPTAYVSTRQSAGPSGPGLPSETVEVDGHEATLSTYVPAVPRLSWKLAGDIEVSALFWSMTTDEILEFANGLEERPDGSGFDATALPQGIEEDPMESVPMTTFANRELGFSAGNDTVVEMHIDRSDEAEFESFVEDRLETTDAVEQLTVLDRPAVLIHYEDSDRWSLQWRHTTRDRVELDVTGVDRASLDRIIAGISEIDEATWQDLVAAHPYAG
jgi:hypothetical protein